MTPDPETCRRLVQRYRKWDLFVDGKCRVIAEPIVLGADETQRLGDLSVTFVKLIDRTAAVCRRRPDLLDRLAFSTVDRALFDSESGPGAGEPHGITRVDWLRGTDGTWRACEFNTDVPGGHCEADGLADLVNAPGSPNLASAIIARLRRHSPDPKVGILLATGYAEDQQIGEYLRGELEAAGIRATVGSPENVTFAGDRAWLFGEPIDTIYRYYPAEWFGALRNRVRLLWAHRNRLFRMVNAFSWLAGQSKNVFALWRADDFELTPDERELVSRHTPFTEPFDPARLEDYRARRAGIVLKRAWGRMGEHVLVGSEYDEADWAAHLAESPEDPREWTVQEFVEPRRVRVAGEDWVACVGVYVVGDAPAAFMTRLSGGPRTAFDAVHVPTRVEPAT